MRGFLTVFNKEWKAFLGSERGLFFFYCILILLWSFILSSNRNEGFQGSELWIVFFSVVITANFSNTIFISERINGALEILITSGLSRNKILGGKLLFINIMVFILGFFCAIFALLWRKLLFSEMAGPVAFFNVADLILYCTVTLLNTTSGAYFSVRMPNPRFLHFTNLLMVGGLVSAYVIIGQYFPLSAFVLAAFFLLAGLLFLYLSVKEFNGEKIFQTVVF